MRVLMISDVYFPRVNGVSTSIQTFRRDLAAHGCETWLVAPQYAQPWADDERVLRQPARYLVFDPEDRMLKPRVALAACRSLPQDIDVVHIQTPFVAHWLGLKVARERGVPVVESYHTFFEEYLHHYVPVLPDAAARAFARGVSRLQCNLGEFTGGDGAAFRERYAIGADRPVMLLVGRVAHEKNIGFLLQVLATIRRNVPDVLFVIAGEGPALAGLRRDVAAAELSSHVLFVGYLDRRGALLDCYRAADVFVFASRTETQGLVLLESLALGVPVVSTAVLGTKEVLHEAEGAIVVEEDVAAFAAAATRVLCEPDLRACLRRAGRDFVAQRWSSAEMAARLLGLYDDLVRTR